ncbi:uncharacterized protein LOC110113394 [Dendrobium catenatum]|uniref:uncharacterized protein LOC110113394 n=1 Tax=Dendrobium catenatum TaxID=906689 RepID=UPI0009F26DB2|nr:uncharacterized protein LOC110113394 [Dendrobium catenatum]
MEGGDEGLVKLLDSKDLQQQSKALDKLTDRVEDRQLDSTRVQEAMAALASSKEADWNTMRMRFAYFVSMLLYNLGLFVSSVCSLIAFLLSYDLYKINLYFVNNNHMQKIS